MTATCTIHFEDGSTHEPPLGSKVVEINVQPERRQSIVINEGPRGEFTLSFTAPLMGGKKFRRIVIEKVP